MIQSFKDKEAQKIFERVGSKKLPQSIQRIALRKLVMIHAAVDINDLRVPPGNRLEPLKGDRKGFHSIRVNDQYRIVFRWVNGDAEDVEVVNYH